MNDVTIENEQPEDAPKLEDVISPVPGELIACPECQGSKFIAGGLRTVMCATCSGAGRVRKAEQ